ncbi:MAG: hypothetical protein KatS3mg132_879 [Limisphaera sp.]|nr:MAG: hypothetical protein KatS3mg132_879 [Limisphaera sp.]
MLLLPIPRLLGQRKSIPVLRAFGRSPAPQQFLEGLRELFEGPPRLEAVPVPPRDRTLAQVPLHLVPDASCYISEVCIPGCFLNDPGAPVRVGRKHHELEAPIPRGRAAVVVELRQEVVDRLARGTRRTGFRVEAVASPENVQDRAVDLVRVRVAPEDHQEMDRPLPADRKLNAGEDNRHFQTLFVRLPGQCLELGGKVAVTVDAVVISERDQVQPLPVSGLPAGRNETLGNLGKSLGLCSLERLDRSLDVFSVLLFIVEGRVHVQVAPQPPRTGFHRVSALRHHKITSSPCRAQSPSSTRN